MANNYHSPWMDLITHFSEAEMTIPTSQLDRALTYNKPPIVSCDGIVSWDATTGVLAWSGPLRIVFNREDGAAILNTVAAGNVTLLDNQFAKVTLDENNEAVITATAATLNPGSASNFLAYNVLVLAYRNAASDALVTIGLPPIPTSTGAITDRLDDVEGEISTARGAEVSLDARLDTMDLAIGGAGTGSVTSVGVSVPADLDVASSPVTTSGTIAITRKVQAQNKFLSGPISGADAAPTYRVLDPADIPPQPFDVIGFYPGVPLASAILLRVPIARPVDFLENFAGAYAIATVASTASTVFDLQKNGVSIGSMTFALGATTATFSTGGTIAFASGDILVIIAPATPDTTLADIGYCLPGLR